MSKPNTIETAREFLIYANGESYCFTETDLKSMVAYASYLNSDSEGQRSAEEILEKFLINNGNEFDGMIEGEDALKAMHEFKAQSLPQLTDEEIEKETLVIYPRKPNEFSEGLSTTLRFVFSWGAKWARTKLTGK